MTGIRMVPRFRLTAQLSSVHDDADGDYVRAVDVTWLERRVLELLCELKAAQGATLTAWADDADRADERHGPALAMSLERMGFREDNWQAVAAWMAGWDAAVRAVRGGDGDEGQKGDDDVVG